MKPTVWALVLVFGASCSEDSSPTPKCDADRGLEMASGECAGVSLGALCGDAFCVPGDAACDRVLYVEEGAGGGDGTEGQPFGDLPEAGAVAQPGDCIALAAGAYGAATLSGAVSIFGAGAALTMVTGDGTTPALVFEEGQGARIRGIRAAGVRFVGVTSAIVEETAVEEAARVGIDLRDTQVSIRHVLVRGTAGSVPGEGYGLYLDVQTDLTMTSSLIERNASAGILAEGRLGLEDSVVRDNGGYGVALQRAAATSLIRRSLVSTNGLIGVFVSGATLLMESSEVSESTDTVDGPARLMEVQEGGNATITGDSVLRDSDFLGVLVDKSRFRMEGGENFNNERGFWVQGTVSNRAEGEQVVAIADVHTHDNKFVGVGGSDAVGIIIQGGIVERTTEVPVGGPWGDIIYCGDGIQAMAGSNLVADGVRLIDNERAAALFDGEGGTTGGVINLAELIEGEWGIAIQNDMPEDGFDETAVPQDLTGDAVLDFDDTPFSTAVAAESPE